MSEGGGKWRPDSAEQSDLGSDVLETNEKQDVIAEKQNEWQSNWQLSQITGFDYGTVGRYAEKFRDEHPEWFKEEASHRGTIKLYHPDLVALIEEEFRGRENAPDGWITYKSLAKLLGRDRETIFRLAQKYKPDNPEWFRFFLAPGGKREFLHPDIIQIIRSELEKYDEAPEGWMTNGSLMRRYSVAQPTIEQIVSPYRLDHPEWFNSYEGSTGVREYFHPDLVKIIEEKLEKRELPPDGWMNRHQLIENIDLRDYGTLDRFIGSYRAVHPEWFKTFFSGRGDREYFHPDLISIVKAEMGSRKPAPEGWLPKKAFADALDTDPKTLNKEIDKFRDTNPDWFGWYKASGGRVVEQYHPDLISLLLVNLKKRETAPPGWVTENKLSDELDVDLSTVQRLVKLNLADHPEWQKNFSSSLRTTQPYIGPELASIIRTDVEGREEAPAGWVTRTSLKKTLGTNIDSIVDRHKNGRPDWLKRFKNPVGVVAEHLHPDLVELVKAEVGGRELAPDGWMTKSALGELLGTDKTVIERLAKRYKLDNPEWFKMFWSDTGAFEYFNPDLVELISDEWFKRKEKGRAGEIEQEQKKSLELLLSEINGGQSIEAKHFTSLINVIGGSHALDILYKFRPEYKGLPPEYVKGVLADYLGDFLVKPQKFTLDNIDVVTEYLSDLSLREGLFETLKEHCLRYYFDERRKDPNRASQDVIYDYLDEIVEKLHHLNSKDLDDVIQDVIRYYDSVLKDFHKPEQFVGSLDPHREFPDINQRINMKELAEKKRLLIADEMGLGKSASVIMAKEQLGIGCALVVAPSNVVSTWKRYLSDRSEDGGYFKPGEAPRVLEVSSVEDLIGVAANQYDYVLISQERMNDRYTEALGSLDYDMFVVDEIHKLKSLEGQRTSELMELSKKVEGEGKYLAMLSGTPAPNKVEDIAISLKLLYPEKFAAWDDRDLVRQIIQGDLVDLRSLLLPRMQAKRLEEGVEMPELHEEKIETELSPMEMDIYEVLLEDDELEAAQKMAMLRQFLMNPDLLDTTPGIHSAKIERVANDLRERFAKNNKAVLFVNGYIEGVIRGKDNIIEKFGLPEDIEVRVIHGGNRDERESIQKEFKETAGKMLLVVSGQTADVGVDFTPAETVFTYNEPWTEYDRRQQVSRVYRPGLKHDLDVRTFVAKNTLEEGIHEYIGRKYQAIEKLLHGIPIQELEKQLLSEDEKSNNRDLEVNRELAEYYFSSWDKLMRIFAHVKEIGEEDFKEFLSEYGKDYADCYLDLGNRSYQANANRVAGTLLGSMLKERGGKPEETLVLDVASGPEMLRQHIGNELQEQVISVDANPFHFKAKEGQNVKSAVASWRELPFREKSFDYLNLALALHYSNFVPSKGKLERLEVLKEANRVLKPGGRAVISFIYSLDLRDITKFHEFAEGLGFRVVDEYSGEVAEGDEYKSRIITMEKTTDFNGTPENVLDKIDVKDYSGFKFKKTNAKLKGQRNIIEQFGLHGRKFDVDFNAHDSEVRVEEQTMLAQGNALKEKHGGVINIPKSEIIDNKFVRIRVGEKYLLFKKLEKGSGVVIVK